MVVAALRGVAREPVVQPGDHGRSMPTRFAATDELTPEELRRRRAALAAAAEPARRAGVAARQGRQGARRARHRDRRRPARAPAPRAPRPRATRAGRGRARRGGGGAPSRSTVRSVTVRPMRNRRRKRVEARVADESGPMVAVWFNQPWLARQLGRGRRRAAARQAAAPQPVVGDRARGDGGGRRRRRPHARARARLSRQRGHHAGAAAPARLGRVPARSTTWSSRCPAGCGQPSGSRERPAALAGDRTSPTARRTSATRAHRLAFEELFLLAARRRRAQARARARAASARPLAPTGELVDRWLPVAPVRARPATSGRRSTEIDADLAAERPMQRLLMGEVGTGKTVVALHAMLRAVENGAPGGAHGAHRDARRAAPCARSTALLGGHAAGRAADRLDDRARAGASCSAGSPSASSSSWSARTR